MDRLDGTVFYDLSRHSLMRTASIWNRSGRFVALAPLPRQAAWDFLSFRLFVLFFLFLSSLRYCMCGTLYKEFSYHCYHYARNPPM